MNYSKNETKEAFCKKGEVLISIRPMTIYKDDLVVESLEPGTEFLVEDIKEDGYNLKTDKFSKIIMVINSDMDKYFEKPSEIKRKYPTKLKPKNI